MQDKKRTQKPLDAFFKRRRVEESHIDDAAPVCLPSTSRSPPSQSPIETSTLQPPTTNPGLLSLPVDIWSVVSKPSITDGDRFKVLNNPLTVDFNKNRPFSEHNKGGKIVKYYLNENHINKYDWLIYSPEKRGLFCKFCCLFAPQVVGKSGWAETGVLVKKPLLKFDKMTGKDGILFTHSHREYHTFSVSKAHDFLKTVKTPSKQVSNQVDIGRQKQVMENRARLLPIIDTIKTLGQQNIPLRGHRDDGVLLDTPEDSDSITNEGNFRAILKMRVRAGDKDLEDHLKTSTKGATYISKGVQNEIIEICGELIVQQIVHRVSTTKYYSIIFDETTDITQTSQLSLVVRYVNVDYKNETRIREDFLTFIDAYDFIFGDTDDNKNEPRITGVALGEAVLKLMEGFGLNKEDCVGICTDTCSLMTSEAMGAVSAIMKSCPHAKRVGCSSHCLNLSLSKSSNVKDIRNCIGTVKEVISFLKSSAKRKSVLAKFCDRKLVSLCETRWTERHSSLINFNENLTKIMATLDSISQWRDPISATKAASLILSIRNTQFLVALKCATYVFSITYTLSVSLQKESLDLSEATILISNLKETLQTKRGNAGNEFDAIWDSVLEICQEIGSIPSKPRTSNVQKNRSNPEVDDLKSYYRVTIFNPLLDSLIIDFMDRFPQTSPIEVALFSLLPSNIADMGEEKLRECAAILFHEYGGILKKHSEGYVNGDLLFQEMCHWKLRCSSGTPLGTEAVVVLQNCSKEIYPNCRRLLNILCSIPVTNSSAERTFSSLKRLKTWLRNKMSEDRLVGLALLSTHRDIVLDDQVILDVFASRKQRKFNFIL